MSTDGGAAGRLAGALAIVLGTRDIPLRLRAWDGSEAGPDGAPLLVLHSRRALRRILYAPGQLGLSRAYVAGDIERQPKLGDAQVATYCAAVREGEPESEANRFTPLEAMAFSGMTFLSGGKLVFDPPEYRITPGRPWRDVQICKALFVWERLMGMILIVMFAIAVSKTIILGS